MSLRVFLQDPRRNIDEIDGDFCGFRQAIMPTTSLLLRNTPFRQLLAPWTWLHEFGYRNRIAAENPVAAFEDAVLLALFGIRVGNHDELCRDLARNAFEPDIDAFDERPLKVVKAESMSRVEDERNTGQPGCPASENSRLRAVGMHDLRLLTPKQAKHAEERLEVLNRPDFADQRRHPDAALSPSIRFAQSTSRPSGPVTSPSS